MVTTDEIKAFVVQHLPELNITGEPNPLSGGLMNHVWQVPADPHSVVVKHAPPYIASAPSIQLDDSRIIFEARALEAFDKYGFFNHITSASIRPPRLIARNDSLHTLVLEDIGDGVDLAVWLSHAASTDFSFASFLGKFIGTLHKDSYQNPVIKELFNNAPIQQTRKQVQYDAIGALCAEANLPDADRLGDQAMQLGIRLLEPGVCVVMGDLWPPSIRVTPNGIRIIDWEFVHFGNPAQDIAHLAAHLWMLQHRLPSRQTTVLGFWDQFISSYKEAAAPFYNDLWGRRHCSDAAIHFGAEIIVRTIGPFQQGYLYDGLFLGDPLLTEAIEYAAGRLREPDLLATPRDLLCLGSTS